MLRKFSVHMCSAEIVGALTIYNIVNKSTCPDPYIGEIPCEYIQAMTPQILECVYIPTINST